ncbi:MAG: hypothetical protein QOJ99_3141 [Bryobacterales bacterium]|nr:hypothetical protein [Bryobacterales bacterium]
MLNRWISPFLLLVSLLPATSWAASEWVLVHTVDGSQIEGQTTLHGIGFEHDGKPSTVPLAQVLSVYNGAPASAFEAERITKDIAAIQTGDRAARDQAVEELTFIGLPVMTPLLQAYKDTDQHEPRPLYRLFERIIPSYADGPDRTLSLLRTKTGEALRGTLTEATLEIRSADGKQTSVPWSKIRSLAVRQAKVTRAMQVHSLRHSTQIEYLDTGVALSTASKVDISTRGFVRLSWDTDSWASDANGLTKPGAPAYKTNLVDGQPFGALVGRVGTTGEMFMVGKKAALTGKPAGRLRLAVNDNAHWQNNVGTFYASMTATDVYDLGDAQ